MSISPRLLQLRAALQQKHSAVPYIVPGRWIDSVDLTVTFASPEAYFLHQLEQILQLRSETEPWSYTSTIVYNGLVRHITAWDHGVAAEQAGWSRTGTFLKLLALLPYLRRLHVTTLSILPCYERGVVGRKGTLGSPYAIRHPFRLDDDLRESNIEGTIDDHVTLLVEACHLLGIKVVFEFVPRTASIDSDLVSDHPDWFYWVRRSVLTDGTFTAPVLTDHALAQAKLAFDDDVHTGLPEPDADYRAIFQDPPRQPVLDSQGWHGRTDLGVEVGIPGAFADWPPDDPQPAWSDVTYLKLHAHPHFNYMAYNTIRMYDTLLDLPVYRTRSVWSMIEGLIPSYIERFDIDGALIDMGHAMPTELQHRIVAAARAVKPDFLFWEENFYITKESAEAGYDAVVGYLPFDAHVEEHMHRFLERTLREEIPLRYFGTPETHNTPRAAMRMGSPYRALSAWALIAHAPMALPFIHAGIELGERRPVNTGLGFTEDEIAQYPAAELPLFSEYMLPWTSSPQLYAQWKHVTGRVAQREITSVAPT